MNKGLLPLCGGRRKIWEEVIDGRIKKINEWIEEEAINIKEILKKNS